MSTQDRFYEIDFTNGSDVETLRYQIVDSPIADAWWNIVQGALSASDCQVSDNQWIHNAPNQSIDLLWKRMKMLVDELNTIGRTPYLSMPAEFDSNIDHSKLLNYLHLQFHEFSEQKQNYTTDHTPLTELNLIIHKIEAVLQEGPRSCGFYLTWEHLPTAPGIIHIEDMDWYQLWTTSKRFGDMTLGYHTIGKNIWMCYKDNDVSLVQDGMVRPQKTISSEVNLMFRSDNLNVSNNNINFLHMYKWMENNNLMQYIDMTKSYNRAIGQPLLGRLVGSHTTATIGRILSLGRVGNVRLL
jgi:hypothetical protein